MTSYLCAIEMYGFSMQNCGIGFFGSREIALALEQNTKLKYLGYVQAFDTLVFLLVSELFIALGCSGIVCPIPQSSFLQRP